MNFDVSRHVAADPDTVWSVLTDIPSADRTISGILSVEVLTPGPYQPGYRWRETRKMFGMKATEEMMVTVAEPPRTTTLVAENQGTEYTTVFTVTPDAEGGSTLRFEFSAVTEHSNMIGNVVMAIFGGLAKNATRKTIEQDLADIAAEAERRAG